LRIGARRHEHRAPVARRARIDRGLHCRRVEGRAIALRPKAANVADRRGQGGNGQEEKGERQNGSHQFHFGDGLGTDAEIIIASRCGYRQMALIP